MAVFCDDDLSVPLSNDPNDPLFKRSVTAEREATPSRPWIGNLVFVPDAQMLGRIIKVRRQTVYLILLATGVYVEVSADGVRSPTLVWRRD